MPSSVVEAGDGLEESAEIMSKLLFDGDEESIWLICYMPLHLSPQECQTGSWRLHKKQCKRL